MTHRLLSLLALGFALSHCQSWAQVSAGRDLVARYWSAQSVAAREAVRTEILQLSNDPIEVYQWFQSGPEYSSDVPTGIIEGERRNTEGLRFPYVLLVPESYDPGIAYPVEFHLHGGVSREAWRPGDQLWRRGYDSLQRPDRIVVVPGAWTDAFWWFANQAENLPAILNIVKQTWHIDENRVYLSGVSDGGTGAYFFAFLQPTEWAAFLPYIGHPGVLRNPAGPETHSLFIENLTGKALYMVNGEHDPLYPAHLLEPYVDAMSQAGVDHVFKSIPSGGHDTSWLPDELPAIEEFKRTHVRDPLPDSIQWLTLRTDRYNRNHWIRIDELNQEGRPGRLIAERSGNTVELTAYFLKAFTLLLSPQEIDFSQPVTVRVNGETVFDGVIEQSLDTLLDWAAADHDRSMLFTAELNLRVPG